MKKLACLWVAMLVILCGFEAFAQDSDGQSATGDSIAVMKLDTEGDVDDSLRSSLLDAVRTEVLNSNRSIDARGGDVSYLEMQILTNCDRAASIACYEAATDMLGASQIISGTMNENGTAKLIWYVTGKGIFRTVEGSVTDIDSSVKLAQRLLVGDMGSLVVTSNIPGADIIIDGKRMGMTAEFLDNAQKIKLVAGTYIVAVRMDGYTSQDPQKVDVLGDEEVVVNFDLAVKLDQSKMQRVMKYTGWALLGTGVASMAVGGIVTGLAYDSHSKLRDCLKNSKDTTVTGCDPAIYSKTTPKNINNKANHMRTGGFIALGVGGGLAVIGSTMLILGYFYDFGADEAIAGMPKLNLALSPEYQGMGLQWNF
ncbi:MAG: PEGA domain-containing protein [Bradymonadia bacterium]